MTLTRWLRRNQRYLLAAVAVFLLIVWGIGPALRSCARSAGNERGAIGAEKVTEVEWAEARDSLRAVLRLGMLDPMNTFRLARSGANMRTQNFHRLLAGDFARLVFAEEAGVAEDPIWRFLVLSREAAAAGIRTTLTERRDLLAGLPWLSEGGQFSSERYRDFVNSSNYSDAQLNLLADRLLQVLKLISLKKQGVLSTRAEAWMLYLHRNQRARIRYAKVDASMFTGLLEADPEEVAKFYEQYRETIPDPESGTIGYMAPSRVKVEYAIAGVVTEEDIRQYYQEHKDSEFLVEAEKDEAVPDAGEQAPPQPKYRPLDEVRDEIRRKLLPPKARERVESAMEDLKKIADRFERGPLPLGRIARRHGLQYGIVRVPEDVTETEKSREYVSREELRELAPLGEQIARFAFESEEIVNFPEKFTTPNGPFVICQVLDVREATVQPFDKVKDQVRKDCLAVKALDRAVAFGEKLRDRAAEVGLKEAVAEMNERLANLLRPGQSEDPQATGEEYLRVQESEFFRRSSRGVPGLAAQASAVVEAAFENEPGELTVVKLDPPVLAACVLETVERRPAPKDEFVRSGKYLQLSQQQMKQRRLLDAWMERLLARVRRSEDISG